MIADNNSTDPTGWQAGQDNDLRFGKRSVFARLILNSMLAISTVRGELPVYLLATITPLEFVMSYLTYDALKKEGAW